MSSVTLDQSLVTMLLTALLQVRSTSPASTPVQPVEDEAHHRRTEDLEKKLAELSTEVTKVVTRLDTISKGFVMFVAPVLVLILTAQTTNWLNERKSNPTPPVYFYPNQEPPSRGSGMNGLFPEGDATCLPDTTIVKGIKVRGRFL